MLRMKAMAVFMAQRSLGSYLQVSYVQVAANVLREKEGRKLSVYIMPLNFQVPRKEEQQKVQNVCSTSWSSNLQDKS